MFNEALDTANRITLAYGASARSVPGTPVVSHFLDPQLCNKTGPRSVVLQQQAPLQCDTQMMHIPDKAEIMLCNPAYTQGWPARRLPFAQRRPCITPIPVLVYPRCKSCFHPCKGGRGRASLIAAEVLNMPFVTIIQREPSSASGARLPCCVSSMAPCHGQRSSSISIKATPPYKTDVMDPCSHRTHLAGSVCSKM